MFVDDIAGALEEIEIMARINGVQDRTVSIVDEIIALVAAGDMVAVEVMLISDERSAFIDWLGVINEFIDFQEAQTLLWVTTMFSGSLSRCRKWHKQPRSNRAISIC